MKIRVTDDDIAIGKRGCGTQCPIFHAIKRVMMNENIIVFNHRVQFRVQLYDKAFSVAIRSILLPKEVTAFIDSFDDGNPSQPFEFDLPL